jgi:DNA-binding transcriptional LysR family regulator
MDLHKLSLFLAVAETGSISAAARLKNISQPVLSIHMQSLEDFFGLPLLERRGRGVQLTEAGRLLAQKIRSVFASVEEMKEAVENVKDPATGHIRIGASTTPGVYILPKLLGQFKKEYPRTQLDLQIGNTAQVEHWVKDNLLSLGVIGRKPEQEIGILEAIPFLKDELVVVSSNQAPFKKKKSIRIEELQKIPFILREEGSNTRATYERILKQHGIQLNVALELGSTEAIKQAVAAGLGISILSPLSLQWEKKFKILQTIRVIGKPFVRQFHIIHIRNKHLSPATARFLDQMRMLAGNLR